MSLHTMIKNRTCGDEGSFFDLNFPSMQREKRNSSNSHLPSILLKFRGFSFHSNSEKSSRISVDEPMQKTQPRADVLSKYFSKFKPLYARASKRYSEKLRLSGPLKVRPDGEGAEGFEPPVAARLSSKSQRSVNGNIQGGFRVVCRRLRKSRSASAAVAFPATSSRRDDSLLELQDGIQSAIAHCKQSFSSSAECRAPLVRSRSDPGEERTKQQVSKSFNVDV